MKFILILITSLILNFTVLAEIIKPNPNINPKDVIIIQLDALMNNDTPFKDAGILQTWEFAHPMNRQYTGPLSNFTQMMKSNSYSSMINHLSHNIIIVSQEKDLSNYFVELIDKNGNKLGFTWIVKKVSLEGQFTDCWMTTAVSQPLPLAKSA